QRRQIVLQVALGVARVSEIVHARNTGRVAEAQLILIVQRVGEPSVRTQIIELAYEGHRIKRSAVIEPEGVAELNAIEEAEGKRTTHGHAARSGVRTTR